MPASIVYYHKFSGLKQSKFISLHIWKSLTVVSDTESGKAVPGLNTSSSWPGSPSLGWGVLSRCHLP